MVKAMGCKCILRRMVGPSQVIDGIFENQAIETMGAIVNQPVLTICENELKIENGDTLEIYKTVYSIREQIPDGDEFIVLTLRRE